MPDATSLSRVVKVPADNTTGPLRHFKKSADDELRYCFDWSAWLTSCEEETIEAATWTVPAGLTESDDETETTETSNIIAGGTEGETYTITCEITTPGGQTVKATFSLTIVEED